MLPITRRHATAMVIGALWVLTACAPAATADAGMSEDAATATVSPSEHHSPSAHESQRSPVDDVTAVRPDELELEPNPDVEGVSNAVVTGDPTGTGIYVLVGRMDRGAVFPPHRHPDDRVTTVLSGTMYYGVGDEVDRSEAVAYPQGSVVVTPAGTPHWMWSRDAAAVLQETGYGPTANEPIAAPSGS